MGFFLNHDQLVCLSVINQFYSLEVVWQGSSFRVQINDGLFVDTAASFAWIKNLTLRTHHPALVVREALASPVVSVETIRTHRHDTHGFFRDYWFGRVIG